MSWNMAVSSNLYSAGIYSDRAIFQVPYLIVELQTKEKGT
jgi:hypothetical protein